MRDGRILIEIDPRYFRPAEVDLLLGDASKARSQLGWEPKVTFDGLVRLMVDHDLELAKQEVQAADSQKAGVKHAAHWGVN